MLRKIEEVKALKKLYKEHIQKDFPKNEYPPYFLLKYYLKKGKIEAFLLEEEGKEKAYCINCKANQYVLVLLLAVYQECRGEGIGTKLLSEIKNYYKQEKGIFLEVEIPKEAKEEKENQIREKRIRFYEKSSFQKIDEIILTAYGVNYYLMYYTEKPEEKKEEKEKLVNYMIQCYLNLYQGAKRYIKYSKETNLEREENG